MTQQSTEMAKEIMLEMTQDNSETTEPVKAPECIEPIIDSPLYQDSSCDLLNTLSPLKSIPAYEPTVEKSYQTLMSLRAQLKTLPLFQEVLASKSFEELEAVATDFRQRFTDVVILGTGGSSLGGQSLCALSEAEGPALHFLDNIDPHTFHRLFQKLNLAKTGVIAISKSGNTAETLMQLVICQEHWQRKLGVDALSQNFLVISETKENAIRELGDHYKMKTLGHPDNIGGRFAVFTVVGLLPALLAGLNIRAFRAGAQSVLRALDECTNPLDCPPIRGAIISYLLAQTGCNQSVLMPYIDRLNTFSFWYRQLWAESLGKNGKGTTPINALGTVDQHSQLQLYLDGPNDKFFTIVTMPHDQQSLRLRGKVFQHSAFAPLQGKTMGQLMMAEQRATIDTLLRHRCPTRVLHINELNEATMGALKMHFVVETLAMAHLLEVNPFDQPAVEDGKILARQYLASYV